MDALRARLIYNGAIVILLGLLAGFPYALVVSGQIEGSERAWRMAHLEGLLNGMLALLAAGVWDALVLGGRQRYWLVVSLLVAGYGNALASILGAVAGVRGLAPGGSVANTLVFLGFMIAIVGVFVGIALLARGGAQALRGGRD